MILDVNASAHSFRSEGEGLAQRFSGNDEKELELKYVPLPYRQVQEIQGQGRTRTATQIYGSSYNRDPEFSPSYAPLELQRERESEFRHASDYKKLIFIAIFKSATP